MSPGDQAPEDAARIRVADQMRRIFHGVMGRAHTVDELTALANALSVQADEIEARSIRVKDLGKWDGLPGWLQAPADGQPFVDSIDRPVSGSGNPWSIPLIVFRAGDRATTTVTLKSGFEGAPGRSHGGVVSAIYDDLCGFLLVLEQELAFTALLTVNYHNATPLHQPLVFSAWVDRREGRKLWLRGECREGTQDSQANIITTCQALFIAVDPMTTPPSARSPE